MEVSSKAGSILSPWMDQQETLSCPPHLMWLSLMVNLSAGWGKLFLRPLPKTVKEEKICHSSFRSLPLSSIIIGVSFGDVAERVSSDARTALASFGATRVANWRGASSYAILGQRGLKQHAHELVGINFVHIAKLWEYFNGTILHCDIKKKKNECIRCCLS